MRRAARFTAFLAFGALASSACGKAIDGGWVSGLSVRAVTPAEGPTVGGTPVTLAGTRFCDGLAVKVDGLPATDVRVFSPERATALMPAHVLGEVAVTVSCGAETRTAAQRFRYTASSVSLETQVGATPNPAYLDVDGDGWMDLLRQDGEELGVHRGLPGGWGYEPAALATLPVYQAAPGFPFTLADFTGDGSPDLLTFEQEPPAPEIRCTLYAGERGFAEAGQTSIAPSVPSRQTRLLRAVDLDGDGRQDLILAEAEAGGSTTEVLVLHGRGGGSFDAGQRLFTAPAALKEVHELLETPLENERNGGLARLELDGDGVSDLVFGWGGADWMILLGSRDRAYQPRALALPAGDGGLIVFDADRHLDRYLIEHATASSPTRTVSVWRGTGVGTFESTPSRFSTACDEELCPELFSSLPVVASLSPRRFDLDEDGLGEFLMTPTAISWAWIELAPAGVPADAVFLGGAPNHSAGLVPGPGGSMRIHPTPSFAWGGFVVPSRAHGSLALHPLLPLATEEGTGNCLGDFTGDGIVDLVRIREGTAVLLEGTGLGGFEESLERSFLVRGTTCTTAHFTDGAADDLFTEEAAYRNDGAGRFVEELPEGVAPGAATLRAQDADGDGRDELEVAVPGSAADRRDVRVYEVGEAGLEGAGVAPGVHAPDGAIPVVADLNADGALDVLRCEGDELVLEYGDAFQAGGRWGDGVRWQARGCSWAVLLGSPGARFVLTGGGTVFRESSDWATQVGTTSDGEPVARRVHGYEATGTLALPWNSTREVSRCDLRGTGRKDDLLLRAGGSLWRVQEVVGQPAVFTYPSWDGLPDGSFQDPRLVGCADLDGDGLDDVVVADGATGLPFLVRNTSR